MATVGHGNPQSAWNINKEVNVRSIKGKTVPCSSEQLWADQMSEILMRLSWPPNMKVHHQQQHHHHVLVTEMSQPSNYKFRFWSAAVIRILLMSLYLASHYCTDCLWLAFQTLTLVWPSQSRCLDPLHISDEAHSCKCPRYALIKATDTGLGKCWCVIVLSFFAFTLIRTESSSTTDTMHVRLPVLRNIQINHQIHLLGINTTGRLYKT